MRGVHSPRTRKTRAKAGRRSMSARVRRVSCHSARVRTAVASFAFGDAATLARSVLASFDDDRTFFIPLL
jgi:hypothetical protein